MPFREQLNEALKTIPLASIDNRLDSPSKMKRIKSRLKRSTVGEPESERLVPDVNVNLKRDKVPLSDSVIREAELDQQIKNPDKAGGDLKMDIPTSDGEMDLEVTDKDLPQEQPQGDALAKTAQIIGQANGQLDGIVKQLMKLSGYYTEQDPKKHKLTEISERLSEISMVLERDFMND